MVKAYLRYEQAASWGVVATGAGDTAGAVCYLPGAAAADSTHGKPRERLATVALERVNLWDTKRGARERQLIPPTSVDDHGVAKPQPRVTRIARSGDGATLACGASDGSVRIWSLEDLDVDVTFRGHKRDVTALRFSRDGSLLVSGGRDGDVVIWDVAGETGIVRLRGHRDQITDCAFLEDERYTQSAMTIGRQVVTTSKDGFVKVWDLEKARVRADVHLDLTGKRGAWTSTRVRRAAPSSPETIKYTVFDCDHTREGFDDESPLVRMGTVTRSMKGRAMTARYHASGNYLGVQGIGRGMEIYRVRDDKGGCEEAKAPSQA
jgi:U3 small nucleolar RNA-associated protein 12